MVKENFNRGWSFSRSSGTSFENLIPGTCTSEEKVDLPHDASICTSRNPEEADGSGNGYFREENYVYRKQFELDADDVEKIVTLEFEGVYQNAFVYVNNTFAGDHPYGYGNFYLDITKYLVFGQTNEIKVVVKNGVPSGRWYTGGGIFRDVNLMVADRIHLIPDGIHLSTVDAEHDLAVIQAESVLCNQGLGVKDTRLRIELLDAEGKLAATDEVPVTMTEQDRKVQRQRLYVDNPHLWSDNTPYLYTYRATILMDGEVKDTETGTFGIRRLQLDPWHGLRVNGKVMKLRGGCLHHDNGIIGTAEFAHAEEVRVRNLKKAGFNAIRSSHYPMSRRLLDACDRYGMYVMDEFSDVWTSSKVAFDYAAHMPEWWEMDVTNMVNKDFNHPSVILYSIGNEIPETGNRLDVQWGRKIADRIRTLDSTRYTTNSMNLLLSVMNDLPKLLAAKKKETGASNMAGGEINEMMTNIGAQMALITTSDFAGNATEEASGEVDITGLNYAAQRYEKDGTKYPNRILVGSETFPMDLDVNWDLVSRLPYVIGDFDWTAYDYLGEAGIGKISYGDPSGNGMSFYAGYPYKAAYCGDLNLLGDPRPTAFWRQTIWGVRHAPYIAVCPPEHFGEKVNKTQWAMTDAVRSWNWKGFENQPVRIEVYSDAESVELLINGNSAGIKRPGVLEDGCGKKNMAVFETKYIPGSVEAVARNDGRETGRDILRTAGEKLHLEAHADQEIIPADGSDIAYVELELQDQNGIRNPEEVKSVSVQVTGAGYLLGFGSADPKSEENYFDTTAKTFEGRLRAAVRAREKGEIHLTFSGDGMEDVSITVKAE